MLFIRPDAAAAAAPRRDGNHLLDVCARWDAGSQRYLSAKHAWLQAAGWRHTIVTPEGHGPGVVSCGGLPSPWTHGQRIVLDAAGAQRLIERAEPDLIEVTDPGLLGWAALAAARHRHVPAVAYCVKDLPAALGGRFGRVAGRCGAALARHAAGAYLRRLYQRFDLVLAPCAAMVQSLRALGLDNVREQGMGVDTALFTPRLRDSAWRWHLERLLGAEPGSRLLLVAGPFDGGQDNAMLAEAARLLGPRTLLLAVGDGPQPPTGPRVRVLSPQPDARLARLMANVDVFLHANARDTLGQGVLEAMACGTPVVVGGHGDGNGTGGGNGNGDADGDSGLLPELVGDAGVVVRSHRAAAWAEALRPLLDGATPHQATNARMRAIGRDWSVVLAEWEARYLALMLQREGHTLPDVAMQDDRVLA